MSRATHRGECQVCGAHQLLPKGFLSLHGYTTRWGFFSGTCFGSGHSPFETSKDLIDKSITDAQADLDDLIAQMGVLQGPATNDRTMVNVYLGSDRQGGRYRWVPGRAKVTARPTEHYVRYDREVVLDTPLRLGHRETYSYSHRSSLSGAGLVENGDLIIAEAPECYDISIETDLDLATHLNGLYSKALAKKAQGLAQYIAWQKERIENWKPRALTPRAA